MLEGWSELMSLRCDPGDQTMLDRLMSEPLSVRGWSRYFRLRRSAVKKLLLRYNAEPVNNKWRLPLLRCPPAYLQDAGIARVTVTEITFQDGSRWDNWGSKATGMIDN